MDAEDYLETILYKRNLVERLAVWIKNLMASHPINPLRLAALAL